MHFKTCDIVSEMFTFAKNLAYRVGGGGGGWGGVGRDLKVLELLIITQTLKKTLKK